jgi:hypothetical protein
LSALEDARINLWVALTNIYDKRAEERSDISFSVFLELLDLLSASKNKGFALWMEVAEWAKKHPEHVVSLSADDAVCANSGLFLIAEHSEGILDRVTVLLIPQFAGEPVFFHGKASRVLSWIDGLKRFESMAVETEVLENRGLV